MPPRSVQIAWTTVSIALLPSLPVAAQSPVQPSERVRVYASTGTREGTFVAADTAAVRIVPLGGGSDLTFPLRTVARLEVQRGRESAAGRGAGIGLVIGALAGGVLAAATHQECEPGVDPACFGIGVEVLGGAAIAGLAGAGVGAIIGAVTKQDHWVPVDVRSGRVGAIPVRGGIGITMTTSF